MEQFIYATYTIVLPIIVTAFMGYVIWLLKNQKKDRDANSEGTKMLLMIKLIEYHDKYKYSKVYVATIKACEFLKEELHIKKER